MTIARIIVTVPILFLAAWIVLMNWACVAVSFQNYRKGIDKHHSTVPLVSALLAGIAFLIDPYGPRFWFFCIPLVDIANLLLLWFPIVLIRQARERKRNTEDDDGEGRSLNSTNS